MLKELQEQWKKCRITSLTRIQTMNPAMCARAKDSATKGQQFSTALNATFSGGLTSPRVRNATPGDFTIGRNAYSLRYLESSINPFTGKLISVTSSMSLMTSFGPTLWASFPFPFDSRWTTVCPCPFLHEPHDDSSIGWISVPNIPPASPSSVTLTYGGLDHQLVKRFLLHRQVSMTESVH